MGSSFKPGILSAPPPPEQMCFEVGETFFFLMKGGTSRSARPREAGLEGQRLGKLLLAPAAGISRAKQSRERDGELGSLRNVSLGACSTSVSLIEPARELLLAPHPAG